MQTLYDEGTIPLVELCDEAVDLEEWPDVSDLFRSMRRFIRPAELRIRSGESGIVIMVCRACAEARL